MDETEIEHFYTQLDIILGSNNEEDITIVMETTMLRLGRGKFTNLLGNWAQVGEMKVRLDKQISVKVKSYY